MCSRGRTCWARRRTLRCSSMRWSFASDSRGQASVEAAFLLPVLMLVLGMLLQPACLLYTRMVMAQAAAETARVLVTSPGAQDAARTFCLNRLSAVPEMSLFHVGSQDDWEIVLMENAGEVSVSIRGHARPLPVFGALSSLVLQHDGQGIVLSVTYAQRLRPSWLGGDADGWAHIWD